MGLFTTRDYNIRFWDIRRRHNIHGVRTDEVQTSSSYHVQIASRYGQGPGDLRPMSCGSRNGPGPMTLPFFLLTHAQHCTTLPRYHI